MRTFVLLAWVGLTAAGCSNTPEQTSAGSPVVTLAPVDPQHEGLTEPHGDHSPHRGGMVLMNGDLHYEVVFSRDGRHRVWFTDAVRSDLPASIASGLTMTISREGEPDERLTLAIDDSGESWIASGRPVVGDDAYVKIEYALLGEPHEVELPFLISPATTP